MNAWRQALEARLADDTDRILIEEDDGASWTGSDLLREADRWSRRMEAHDWPPGSTVGLGLANGGSWLAVALAIARRDWVMIPREPMPESSWRAFAEAVHLHGFADADGVFAQGERRTSRRPRRGVVLCKVTSGTTGSPRVLPFTASQVLADGRQVIAGMGLSREDIHLAHLPFAHSYGLGNLILPLVLQGSRLVVVSHPVPRAIASAVERRSATVLPTVPAVIRALMEGLEDPAPLRGLRLVISAGSRLDPGLARGFLARFGVRVHNFYGSSETGGIAYDADGEASLSGEALGTPLPGVTVERSRSGRWSVTSAAVHTIGNRSSPGTAGRFLVQDRGHLRSGDGALVLEGRLRGFVKRGGRRISLAQVEREAAGVEGVLQVIAFAIESPAGELLAIAVEGTTDPAAFRRGLGSRLPRGARPDLVLVLERFPVTPRGKPDTRRLRELLEEKRLATVPARSGESPGRP